MNRIGGLCLLAVAVVSLPVTACGSVSGTTTAARTSRPAGSTATARPAGLCAAVSEVDSLTVRRGGAGLPSHFRFVFPRQVVVTRPERARAVAQAVCALPRMPHGIFACPADFGISYRLEFAAAGRRLAVVTVDPGGCERVVGAGPVRWTERSDEFWTVLGRAAVVPWPGSGLGGCGGTGRLMCAQGAPRP